VRARSSRLPRLVSRLLDPAVYPTGMVVLDAPVVATGRLELRGYLREQAISRVVHRYGSVMPPAPERHS
jgi:RHH-type proline utilization regulon transcriptional repressor/proline dehydrogenase/delta 1-pyrroline-5-carboxylate dehydrogenase